MYYPEIEQFEQLAKFGNFIPVSREIFSDMETPIRLFKQYADTSHSFLLESVEGGEKWARYSFLGRAPFMTLASAHGKTRIKSGDETTERTGNPVDILKELMARYKGVKVPGLPRFTGGAVGYFGYDIARYFEHLPNVPLDDTGFPDCNLMFFRDVIAYDHLKQRILVIVNVEVHEDVQEAYAQGIHRVDILTSELLSHTEQKQIQHVGTVAERVYESSFTKAEYIHAVEKAKDYIKDGDIFQVVLSQRLSIQDPGDPYNVYRRLRVLNPSPYMYYLNFEDFTVVGSSPELLVRVDDGVVETCPIAGTRPRGKTELEDEQLAKELMQDEKELAEHTMLVDLGRNDLGKVSAFGTVLASNLMHIEKYSHVMHIVTNVTGVLKAGADCYDALAAVLPAGTLSGAPKIRAMEIIDEFEPVKRGLYGGAIGYVGFDGNMDTCITIRTIVFKDNQAYIQAGAGIVADSIPENEYHETLSKAGAMLKALREAGGLA